MASLKVLIQRGAVCRCIRAKTLFYQTEEQEEHDAGLGGPFWCAHTQSALGPDGGVVDVADCQPGRSCCET